MNDLISRQEVIKLIQQYHGYMPNYINHEMYKKAKEIPTAYDVDKVVEQLESFADRIEPTDENVNTYFMLQEAIEIVKGGGQA